VKLLPVLGLTAFLISTPVLSDPSIFQIGQLLGQQVLAQDVQTKQVNLTLVAEKQLVQKDADGKAKVSWQSLGDKAVVQPGDIIRYTVNGKNNGKQAAKNLVITQPIPKRTLYVLNSASLITGEGTITYSVDNGKSYLANPTVQVKLPDGKTVTKPVPAEQYTHIRWSISQTIAPQQVVSATYQVKVR
jgi:uncharacterized repeat protein (TIGR01451 family)